MKKTSGPWSVSSIRTRIGGEPVLTILGADDKPYAFILYGDGSDRQHAAAYADARCFAAALDLHFALVEALPVVRNARDHPDAQPWQREIRGNILIRMEAAIAKSMATDN